MMNKQEFKRQRLAARLAIKTLPHYLKHNTDSLVEHFVSLNIDPSILPTIKSLDVRDYDNSFPTFFKHMDGSRTICWREFRSNRFRERYLRKQYCKAVKANEWRCLSDYEI